MSDESAVSGAGDDNQPTASPSKSAPFLVGIVGIAVVLLLGGADLVFESADGKGMGKKLRSLIVVLAFVTGGLVAFAAGEAFFAPIRARSDQRNAFEWCFYFLSAWLWACAAGEFTGDRAVRSATHDRYALGFAGLAVLSTVGLFAYIMWAGGAFNPTVVIVWSAVTGLVGLVGIFIVKDRTDRWIRLTVKNRITQVLQNDSAFGSIEIVKPWAGVVKLVGSLPKADKERLQETLTSLIGKRFAADAMRGVHAEDDR